jgi:hypothetical protein|tara:strand:+ start:249 stop:419 length:171 start_codon:yes stop_codon:yes gene_type:complete
MKLRVRLDITVDDDASWIPSDGVYGVVAEAEELIIEAVENCIDGALVTVIGVKVDE